MEEEEGPERRVHGAWMETSAHAISVRLAIRRFGHELVGSDCPNKNNHQEGRQAGKHPNAPKSAAR